MKDFLFLSLLGEMIQFDYYVFFFVFFRETTNYIVVIYLVGPICVFLVGGKIRRFF